MAVGIKLTREEAVSRIELKFGKGCLDFSESEYIRGNVKATFTCAKCGHRFEREWMQFSTTKFCCPRCAANRGSSKLTLGLDKAIIKVKAKYGRNTIDFTNSSYVKSTVKSKFKCNICDMVFHKSWNKLISGKHACPYCAVKNAQNRYKLTLKQAIDRSIAKYGDVWDFSKSEYILSHSKTIIVCKKCNKEKIITWTTHLHGGTDVNRCICCRNLITINSATNLEIENKLKHLHPGYSLILPNEKLTNKSILVGICPEGHNISSSLYNMVIQEHGCIKCGHIESSKKRKSEIKDIMVELTRLHGSKLSFDKIKDYKNTHDIISYYCNICKNKSSKDIKSLLHGEGCRCNRVGVDKRSAESMILEADNIHGSKFKYIITPDGRNSKLEYICKECNKSTITTWNEHLRGVGCLNCSPLGIRKHNIESILEREQQIFDNEIICTDSSFGGFDSNGRFKCSKCNKTYVQNWKYHLDGNGCPICKDNRGCLLYYVLVNHNGTYYYKIGITRNSIRARYRKNDSKIIPLAVRDYNIAYDAIAEESNILNSKEFLDYKYRGSDDIMGSYCGNTELFTENILQIPIPDLETQEKLWITRSANN